MNEYYISALSEHGFQSEFDEVFSPETLERLYILKGASGVGKSTLMRKIGAAASKNGFPVEYILCSSDPSSLDGVIINGKVGIVDGTAPHIMDTVCPGAYDSIINLGEYWDREKLTESKETLMALSKEKAEHYSKLYSLLSVHRKLREIRNELAHAALNTQKTEKKLIKLRNKYLTAVPHGKPTLRRLDSMLGELPFSDAVTIVRLTGKRELTDIFMKRLFEYSISKELEFVWSDRVPDTDNIGLIWFPSVSVAFTQFPYESTVNINAGTLFFKEELAKTAVKRSCITNMLAQVYKQAKAEFTAARRLHAKIEQIYIPAMDFNALNALIKSLTEKIIKDAYK